MSVDQYFQNYLQNLTAPVVLSSDEQKMLELGQLEEYLFHKITSKKFRRNKLEEKTLSTIKDKVKLAVAEQKPLYFIFGFGGFKNSNLLQHHPHIGWGEIFNLMFVAKLLAPLLQVYKPGVIFEYESENEGAEYANNYTKEDNQTYNQDFKNLISFLKPYLPANLEFRYVTLSEQYDTSPMFAAVEARLPEEIARIKALPPEEQESAVRRALHNLKLKGTEDLTQLSETDLKERAIASLAKCYLFLEEDYKYREHYFNGDERIMTIGSYCTPAENPDNWITINSTAYSPNAFWTSTGILEQEGDSYKQIIIGPGKYEEIKDQLVTEPTTVFSELVPGLDQIDVLQETSTRV